MKLSKLGVNSVHRQFLDIFILCSYPMLPSQKRQDFLQLLQKTLSFQNFPFLQKNFRAENILVMIKQDLGSVRTIERSESQVVKVEKFAALQRCLRPKP